MNAKRWISMVSLMAIFVGHLLLVHSVLADSAYLHSPVRPPCADRRQGHCVVQPHAGFCGEAPSACRAPRVW